MMNLNSFFNMNVYSSCSAITLTSVFNEKVLFKCVLWIVLFNRLMIGVIGVVIHLEKDRF